jgi:hypothetical protein
MKRTYTDISGAIIGKGDVIIVLDDENPEIAITLRVNTVEDDPDWDHRVLNCLIVSVSEPLPGVVVGNTLNFDMSKTTPTRGVHIKNVDLDVSLTYAEKQESIIAAIIEFLNTRLGQNYRATYRDVLTFLESGGYIDSSKSYEVNRKYLTNLFKQNDKYFNVTGKYVQYTGRPFVSNTLHPVGNQEAVTKRVRWGKFVQGARLIFESLGYRIDD